MIFNRHSELSGKHAFLSPSQPAWVNYDDQKLTARYHSVRASQRGTDLHDLAMRSIRLRVLLDESNLALAAYVADALEFGMTCEQALFYSENCFGTADTISFHDGLLRIHDLKTGITKANIRQLEIYAALFCLEYGESPHEIQIELRIYQRDQRYDFFPTAEEILFIMDRIIASDAHIETVKEVW